MTVQETINSNLKIAMKEKNVEVRDLLRVVIGEFNRVDKVVSDEKAFAIIKKMVENAKEQGHTGEVTILEAYLPRQWDKDQLTKEIEAIIKINNLSTMKDMGQVMSALKNCCAGKYDGKLASTIVRELLK